MISKKHLIFFFSSVLFSQTLYQGSIDFSYSGSETGAFSSSLEDTTSFGGALNISLNDSSSFLMMGITQRQENVFDLFLTVLEDTTFPIQPRAWSWNISITDIANIIEDPLSLSTLSFFVPNLDSSFANQWLTFFTDSSNASDSLSLEILSSFFVENLIDDSYIATQGDIEINEVNEEAISGNFSFTMWKPLFSFTNINSGLFNFSPVSLENLSTSAINNNVPKTFSIQEAFPNPFNPEVKIPFETSIGQFVNISVFDINGKLVKNLSNKYWSPGEHSIKFSDNRLTSGIYFVTFFHKKGHETKKITLLK